MLDLGIGPGDPAVIVTKTIKSATLVGLDISIQMLLEAKDRLHEKHFFICGDASSLPFCNQSFDVAYSVAAVHLFGDKQKLFAEARRILRPKGAFIILDVLTEHLGCQIYHRYLPSFHESERARHVSREEIERFGRAASLSVSKMYSMTFDTVFGSVEDLVNFVASRPFFGLQQMDDKKFSQAFEKMQLDLSNEYGSRPVVNTSVLSMAVLTPDL